jgi:hypothetical protein
MIDNAIAKWEEARRWLTTTTGQEFCDELIYGTVGDETVNSLLRSFNITDNDKNRKRFLAIADDLITHDYA